MSFIPNFKKWVFIPKLCQSSQIMKNKILENTVFHNNIKHNEKKKLIRKGVQESGKNIKLQKESGFENIDIVNLFEHSPILEEITDDNEFFSDSSIDTDEEDIENIDNNEFIPKYDLED